MKSDLRIFLEEIGVFVLVIVVLLSFWLFNKNFDENFVEAYTAFRQGCIDLNLALVVTMMVSFIVERKIQIKGRQLKRVTREAIILIMVNSLLLLLSNFFGVLGMAVVVAGLYGNFIKVWELCREVLGII